MALSKDEVQLIKEMIADKTISKEEKDMYREMLGETTETPAAKTTTKTKAKPKAKKKKAKKVNEGDIEKMKAQIKSRTGKTEEECEKIVNEYRELRAKSTTRKKKEKVQAEQGKKRVSTLKKEGKVIQGTTEKNVEATIDTATKTATKKVDKEIAKIEKTSKTEKQIEKKIDNLVNKALASSKKFVGDMAKELSTKSKDDGRTYLMGLRRQIDNLLKKYELGGEVFDGSGDGINFGGGGFTQPMDIQASLIMQGNNTSFKKGGEITSATEYHELRNKEYKKRVNSGIIKKDTDENFMDFDDEYFNELVNKGKIDVDNYFAKGGSLSKEELKLNLYKPSEDYFMDKKGGKIILHLTSKDASNLPPSFFEKYNVEKNGKGYYGTSYIVSKKYAKGGKTKGGYHKNYKK